MTTSAVYDLIPNEDAGQNTRYPLGDKPAAELTPPVPTDFSTGDETYTSVRCTWDQPGEEHTKFILQRWRLNVDTAWATLTEPGEFDRSYTDSADLQQGQHVGYRIASSDGTNQSEWAPESWTYVLVESTGSTDLTKLRWHSSGASWDALADGITMNGIDGMWSATSSEISSEVLLGGHKVAKDRLDIGGDYGFGFGRTIPDLPYGAEMWFRVWLWHPPAFDFSTNVNVRKTMRVRSKPTSTSLDVARINNKDAYPPNEIGAWYTAKENAWNGPDNGSWCLGRDGSQDFRTSQWDCLEVYTNSTISDTEGRWKVWMNGVLVGEVTQKTLTNTGDVLQDCMYLSNWNDGVPQAQHYYWASPAIAVRYSGRDDTQFMDTSPQGFPFIGMAT